MDQDVLATMWYCACELDHPPLATDGDYKDLVQLQNIWASAPYGRGTLARAYWALGPGTRAFLVWKRLRCSTIRLRDLFNILLLWQPGHIRLSFQ
mgnify:CR=1 FL=1